MLFVGKKNLSVMVGNLAVQYEIKKNFAIRRGADLPIISMQLNFFAAAGAAQKFNGKIRG